MSCLTLRLAAAVLGLAATGANAQQTDLCGGIGENGQWIGSDAAGSDISRARSSGTDGTGDAAR